MKITTTNKQIENAPKKYTRVVINEGNITKTVERDSGVTEIVIGTGKYKDVTSRDFISLCRKIVRTALVQKHEYIAVQLSNTPFQKLNKIGEEWIVSTMAENFVIAQYEFTAYKTEKKKIPAIKEILICGGMIKKTKAGFNRGLVVGEYVNKCRDIANTSGGDMTPALLAREAQEAVRGTKAKVKVLNKKAIEKLKMGSLLGVAQGSRIGPRFIIVEYWGAPKRKERPIVFVGKGITFDTGGLSLKPSEAMLDMHLDMSGGAAVLATVAAAAKLKLKRNIIGLVPAAENAVSDESMRPGDILTSMSGKTIDVLNTDAEGRLVLADALTYAKRYNPRLVIDIATLTGAALVALGEHASAVLTKDDTLRQKMVDFGEESGDYVWPLPLWDVYKQYMKGRFADVANLQTSGSPRNAGTIAGAIFLSHFTEDYKKDCPWAHIDMAPRMTSVQSDNLAKGATGEPVRLLIKIAEHY